MENVMSREAELKMERFNLSFLLATDCYLPSVSQKLLKDCQEDNRMFGLERAQKKWSKFVEGSLTGKGDVKPLVLPELVQEAIKLGAVLVSSEDISSEGDVR